MRRRLAFVVHLYLLTNIQAQCTHSHATAPHTHTRIYILYPHKRKHQTNAIVKYGFVECVILFFAFSSWNHLHSNLARVFTLFVSPASSLCEASWLVVSSLRSTNHPAKRADDSEQNWLMCYICCSFINISLLQIK